MRGSAADAELVFREANELIAARARSLEIEDPFPLICECQAVDCTTIIRVQRADYDDVRAHDARFLLVPGHRFEGGRIVKHLDGCAVVERSGAVAEGGEGSGRTTTADRP